MRSELLRLRAPAMSDGFQPLTEEKKTPSQFSDKKSFFLTETDCFAGQSEAPPQRFGNNAFKKHSPQKQLLLLSDAHSAGARRPPDTPVSALGGAGQEVVGAQSAKAEALLENQKLLELKAAALSMKGSLVSGGRCPKCTLKPPCKHFERAEELPSLAEVQPPRK